VKSAASRDTSAGLSESGWTHKILMERLPQHAGTAARIRAKVGPFLANGESDGRPPSETVMSGLVTLLGGIATIALSVLV